MSKRKSSLILPDSISAEFEMLKKNYGDKINDLEGLGNVAIKALNILGRNARKVRYYELAGLEETLSYDVFVSGENTSRPIRSDLFMTDPDEFEAEWSSLCLKAFQGVGQLQHVNLSSLLYTCVLAVASYFDVFAPSKKPPGTFLEIMVGSFASRISGLERQNSVQLHKEKYDLSLDIVIKLGSGGLVFPCKVTSRERIIQVFAHQRILDSAFGVGTYRSMLIGVSENQLDKKGETVKDICIPDKMAVYQKYLAKLEGLYYLDPPAAYCRAKFAQTTFRPYLPVKDLSLLFSQDLAMLIDEMKE